MYAITDWLFGAEGFMPHGHCFLWSPDLLWTFVVADLTIALAYFSIPFALWQLTRKRRDLPFRNLFILCAAFVVACGVSHVLEVVNLWQPAYGLSALVKALTALISLTAAVKIWPMLPYALALPSTGAVEKTNQELQREIEHRQEVEAALLRRQADLAEAQRIAHVGSWEWLVATETVYWSNEMYRITGRDPRLGPPRFSERRQLYSPENWQRISAALSVTLETGKPYKLDVALEREDGRTIWITARGEVERDDQGQIVKLRGTIHDITDYKAMEQERAEYAERQAQMSLSLVAVQEEERRRLSAELHDRTSPNLAAIKLNLGLISARLPAEWSAAIDDHLEDTRALLDDTAASIREISTDLRPPVLDYAGLQPALEAYTRQVEQRSAMTINLTCTGLADLRTAPTMETHLFRIVQEALTNCAKHARASQVNVSLAHDAQQTVMTIVDDGIGFDQNSLGQPDHAPGFGLITMRERAEFMGGSLHIESRLGKGTWITVEIPV